MTDKKPQVRFAIDRRMSAAARHIYAQLIATQAGIPIDDVIGDNSGAHDVGSALDELETLGYLKKSDSANAEGKQ
jgi:hypothetical protein